MASPYSSKLRQRLLHDVAEIQNEPYANIKLTLIDLTRACLVLTPTAYPPLHLTIYFHSNYPLTAPTVTIQTKITHPNVFGNYICASILNTTEGYTPAYTLKGICIQLLSFFSSDRLEQYYGEINLNQYRSERKDRLRYEHGDGTTIWTCPHCKAGCTPDADTISKSSIRRRRRKISKDNQKKQLSVVGTPIGDTPDEILLEIMEYLEFEHLTAWAQAWPRISSMLSQYDIIHVRELQCFVLKKNYKETQLGVGVMISKSGAQGKLQSEFDLLSGEAFYDLNVRDSVHGIPFTHWLPLPISHPHWRSVSDLADESLSNIQRTMAQTGTASKANVIFAFINDIVVRLNLDLERQARPSFIREREDMAITKSTLRHASEKAMESYFHLFHLLLCLATGPNGHEVVNEANRMIRLFMRGQRNKSCVPNLGHLIVAMLISDVEVTDAVLKAIITEAITRNVVWLLDGKGAGLADLGYLEDDEISFYRLKRTFQGSRTSYRLLMFCEMFRRIARQGQSTTPESGDSSPSKSLIQIRDELFDRHGGPPAGTAAFLASEVRRLQQVDEFPSFMREMGIKVIPGPKNFTGVLRDTVRASLMCGYTGPVSDITVLSLRMMRDEQLNREIAMRRVRKIAPNWVYSSDIAERIASAVRRGKLSFFPRQDRQDHRRRR